jgi:hypothetical protein
VQPSVCIVEQALRTPRNPDLRLLVRPDGYVACAVRRAERSVIDEYLTRLDRGNT